MKNKVQSYFKFGKTSSEEKSFSDLINELQKNEKINKFANTLYKLQEGINSQKMINILKRQDFANFSPQEVLNWQHFFAVHEIKFLGTASKQNSHTNFKITNKLNNTEQIVTIDYHFESREYQKAEDILMPPIIGRIVNGKVNNPDEIGILLVSPVTTPLQTKKQTITYPDIQVINKILDVFKKLEQNNLYLEEEVLSNWMINQDMVKLAAHSHIHASIDSSRTKIHHAHLLGKILYEFLTGIPYNPTVSTYNPPMPLNTKIGTEYWRLIQNLIDARGDTYTINLENVSKKLLELEFKQNKACELLFTIIKEVQNPLHDQIIHLLLTEKVSDFSQLITQLISMCTIGLNLQNQSPVTQLCISLKPTTIFEACKQLEPTLYNLKNTLNQYQTSFENKKTQLQETATLYEKTVLQLKEYSIPPYDKNMDIFLKQLRSTMETHIENAPDFYSKIQCIQITIEKMNKIIKGLNEPENQKIKQLWDVGINGYKKYTEEHMYQNIGKIIHHFFKPNRSQEKIDTVKTAMQDITILLRAELKKTLQSPGPVAENLRQSLDHKSFTQFWEHLKIKSSGLPYRHRNNFVN